MTFRCIRCGYETNTKGDMKKHINRKRLCKHILKNVNPKDFEKDILNPISEKEKHVCNYCGNKYSRKDNLNRHIEKCMENCKEKPDKTLETMNRLVDALNKKDNEIEELRNLIRQAGFSKNTTNITNNITNNTMNIILPYNETDLSHLTGRDYYRSLTKCIRAVPMLIEKTHFNKNKPENHNIYIPNIRGKYVMIWDGKKWFVKNKNEAIDQLIQENEIRLEDWVSMGYEKYPQAMKKFKIYISKRDEKGVPETIRNEIEELLYNNRDMVKEAKETKETKKVIEVD